ncbi:type I-E CRISPR-associated protein Cas5/CasD [Amycolatopsis acidicola]|uniref:Type I-E CRISPR-associated protein Cas5/CasD n=1 Tax=Amycolatopsis acidicola TaxID=2596893 RepID=A0A5N0V0H0_9PSEU|nr:type I-E CRISPR-associated protein Cas5/CasD [Amycolatopsis acidicola]KAA9157937.1 type I-E CRISPR-associated protein Cas5/CasD [Amycolatopsis acidicola]
MTDTLALCFDAPMQSWGLRARGVLRDTAREPTKSGVVGILAAASGIARDDEASIAELAALRLGIRVDREGLLERDYHTTQNVPTTQGTGHRTVVSERYYLADALFLAVVEGPHDILAKLAEAVTNPRWPLFLGRRAFVPARPLFTGLHSDTLDNVLRHHPWLEHPSRVGAEQAQQQVELRTVIDCPPHEPGTELRHDVPQSFADGARRFTTRTVQIGEVPLTDDMIPHEES